VGIVDKLQHTTVDLVVAGHTHRAANTMIGRIPVVEGFNAGISYSVAQMMVDDDRDDVVWTAAATRLAKNLGVAQRADVKAIVDKAAADTAPLRNVVIGNHTVDIVRDNPARLRESAMGNLVADAMRLKYADDGVQAAITNSGGLRADFFQAPPPMSQQQPGQITWGEAFAVLPFGNSTIIETLTYEQLVAALANGFRPPCGDSSGGTGAHAAVLRAVGGVPLQRQRAGDRQRLARAARPAPDDGAARPGQHGPDRHERLHVRRR
jgi:2',3'-cyclic-nucleotide 2'-phosphodiesterase (5'-nucleotidase family)